MRLRIDQNKDGTKNYYIIEQKYIVTFSLKY